MSETEIQLQITFSSIFEKLKIFKFLLTEEQLIDYNEKSLLNFLRNTILNFFF
jgi:hypothetical protein